MNSSGGHLRVLENINTEAATAAKSPRWNIPSAHTEPTLQIQSRPAPYRAGLTPLPSPLRPHCLAREQLRLWTPIPSRNTTDRSRHPLHLPEAELAQILDFMSRAWEEGTRESYGTGLLIYHVFCDQRVPLVPEFQRAPISPTLLMAFISCLAGSYAGKTLSNYMHGVRAWHVLHGVPWSINENELEAALRAAERSTPASSKRKKRRPYTVEFIVKLRGALNLEDPLDAAIYACLTTCFYAVARLGEFTVKRLNDFDPRLHITPAHLKQERNRDGLEVTVLHIPRTKVSIEGEDVTWSTQNGPTDPTAALQQHFQINSPPQDGHLFAYKDQKAGTHKPLTKSKFLKRIAQAAKSINEDPLQGHGIRIGATLEYLLRNVPFEVVKVMGRWASNAFTLYLRKHGQIMAPYLQAVPELHQEVIRHTMPPVR